MFDGRNILLRPAAALYGGVTSIRNFLYNRKLITSTEFDIPVLCVGNLSMGGTGKTPHTEYIVNLLSGEFNMAVLSRGYKRKSSGFRFVGESSRVAECGDEPLQIKTKFPSVTVAVDADRVSGIQTILAHKPDTDIIVLDDGFQHRRVRPGLSVVLTSYGRLFTEDHLLPFGSLRENRNGIARADIVVVSKTPPEVSGDSKRKIADSVRSRGVKEIFFTSLRYNQPVNAFDRENRLGEESLGNSKVILVTAIANPEPLTAYAGRIAAVKTHLKFRDHHDFSKKDIEAISSAFGNLKSTEKYILTTEKDAVRFREIPHLSEEIKKALFYIPVAIDFPDGNKDKFDKLITDYARTNK